MPIKRCIKVKHKLGYIFLIMTTIGMNGSIDARGHKLSFIESIILALICFMLIKIMFSDWMYDYLVENGAKVNYNFFQHIAVYVWILFFLVIFFASLSGHGYAININIIEVFFFAFIIYYVVCRFRKG